MADMDNVSKITIHYRLVYIVTHTNGTESSMHQGGTIEACPDTIPSPRLTLELHELLKSNEPKAPKEPILNADIFIHLTKLP